MAEMDAIAYFMLGAWLTTATAIGVTWYLSRRSYQRHKPAQEIPRDLTTIRQRRIREQLAIYDVGLHEYLRDPKKYLGD